MRRLIANILAACLGLLLAFLVVPGISVSLYSDSSFLGMNLTTNWQLFAILGIILGILNFFVRPVLEIITLPLRIITLGLFSFVINVALVFVLDAMFKEIFIPLWMPLIYTSLIIWVSRVIISSILIKQD